MKEKLQTYVCKLCNTEVRDKKVYLDGHCAKCKLLRLKMSYPASRLKDINKFEAHQQIKKLRKKGWEDMDEDDFSEAKITSMLNKPKPSSRKRPVPFPQDVKKTPPVKRKQKDKYRRPFKSVEDTEQKDMEEQESASEASEIKSSDSKSSEDECSNLGGIKFTVKRDWEGQVNYYPANEEHFIIYYPER